MIALLVNKPVLQLVQDEVREKDKQVKELTSALAQADSQLHGLQTVLAAKTGACNRLDSEMSKLERHLKQVQATADADGDGYRQQLEILSERVLQLEHQLSITRQREQQLQLDLQAKETKVRVFYAVLVCLVSCGYPRQQMPSELCYSACVQHSSLKFLTAAAC